MYKCWDIRYFICTSVTLSGFTSDILISSWTCIKLCTGRCCYQQRWLRHTQKQTQQRWICFQRWFRWFTHSDSTVTKFITFSPKNHPHYLHFRWRNSITGWNISKISTSFHHALMALGIRRSAMENSDGQLRYSRKTNRGCNFAHLAEVRGLILNKLDDHWIIVQSRNSGLTF